MSTTISLTQNRRRGRPPGSGDRWKSGDLKPARKAAAPRMPIEPRPMALPPPSPEKRLRMTRADAVALIGPLLPTWRVYARAAAGTVAYEPEKLRAALLLYELQEVVIAQRRADDGATEYLIRRRKDLQ